MPPADDTAADAADAASEAEGDGEEEEPGGE